MKIKIGAGLLIFGVILIILGWTVFAVEGFMGMKTPHLGLIFLGSIILISGSGLLSWSLYQWMAKKQREEATKVIAEGIKKAQEEKQEKEEK